MLPIHCCGLRVHCASIRLGDAPALGIVPVESSAEHGKAQAKGIARKRTAGWRWAAIFRLHQRPSTIVTYASAHDSQNPACHGSASSCRDLGCRSAEAMGRDSLLTTCWVPGCPLLAQAVSVQARLRCKRRLVHELHTHITSQPPVLRKYQCAWDQICFSVL